jgi:hypothetical protein
MMQQRFTHMAVTVPRQLFDPDCRAEWLAFYADVFGWTENPQLAIAGERIFLRAPTNEQYITVRASDSPMHTSGYEHLRVEVATPEDVRQLHALARTHAERDARVELGEVEVSYGGRLHSFRVRYCLPVAIEVQCFVQAPLRGERA